MGQAIKSNGVKQAQEEAIPFNKPHLTGKEMHFMYDAVYSGKISGNGKYTALCQQFFEKRYGFKKALLTTSCTDALEMTAILAGIKEGDEVIMPSYTFVSTALAFTRQGGKAVFVDSRPDHPGMDEDAVEQLITPKTRAIVAVHYAGVACDMDKLTDLADTYGLILIEDAAQAIESYYKGRPLGSIGHMATFSFHETKNIISGEGGLLVINDERFIDRAEIIWEKGTNRMDFNRGVVRKYEWVDTGSSFLPSELTAAFLWAQLENLENIQTRRIEIWKYYHEMLLVWSLKQQVRQPVIPAYAVNNAHMYYLVFPSQQERERVSAALKEKNILAVFHYVNLHKSKYYLGRYPEVSLPNSETYTRCLLRLPMFYELNRTDQEKVVEVLYGIN